jgi:large exoprotein involved in heme utilization and adhesion
VNVTAADTITLLNGAVIATNAHFVDAGDIIVTTPSLTLSDGSSISAQSLNDTGGNLIINADHLKLLNGSEISTSVFGDLTTQGGNVTLNSTNIVALDGSKITAQATEGLGGNITVNAEVFLHDAPTTKDVLNASSETFGNDGTVELNAPTTDISGSLVALNTPYLDATAQLSSRCGGQFAEERSRFIIQGRGSLPPDPGDAQAVNAGRCRAATDSLPRTTAPEPLTTAMTGFGDR